MNNQTEQRQPLAPDHNYNRLETNSENMIPNEGSAAEEGQSDKATTGPADVEKILDLIRWDEKSAVKCLVKFKGITKPQWVNVDEIKRTDPIRLIDYYETRVILRKKQYQMAFERTASSPDQRKLIVMP